MKPSNLYVTLLCMLVASATVSAAISDWTVEQSVLRADAKCVDQIKKLETVWTGDCEGSYAAMAASVIQDNICIAFGKTTITDANLQKLINIKVSYTDLICNCDSCHQFPGEGCNGGNLFETLTYVKDQGFVGGANKDGASDIDITGDIWKTDFTYNYSRCLNYFKAYCEIATNGTNKCQESNNPTFDKAIHCGAGTTVKTCPSKSGKKISEARQKSLISEITTSSGRNLIKAALDNGPLVSTMEIYSDIFFAPKDTVYIPKSGGSLGIYSVKIVGYVETATNQGYWKILLPFDLRVGNNGIVWVKAGLNIGGLELSAYGIKIKTDLIKPVVPPTVSE